MFSEKITAYYRSLINSGDPEDPLSAMLCFSESERNTNSAELADPIGDEICRCAAHGRLVHRYSGRVLLLLTDRCAAHCRFCFRRERLCSSQSDISDDELSEALEYVSAHKDVKEIILSGGDPLSLADSRLAEIIKGFRKAGAGLIRLHTRYPVYEPSRCYNFSETAVLIDTIVVHVNHHREITPEFIRAAASLKHARFLLNQSVLLKGVNDSREELTELFSSLGRAGILPYYLHYPDMAPGTAHFRVPLEKAFDLMRSLQDKLPGYLVPRLILDIPGGKGKITISGTLPERDADGFYLLKSPLNGEIVRYREIFR